MLLFDFFFLTATLALSISSSRADRIRSRKSSALSHVKSNGFFFFSIGANPLYIPGALPSTQRDAERGAMGNGHLLSSCPLWSQPWARPAGSLGHLSLYGPQLPSGVLGKTLPDCGGCWVEGERDTTHHLHPLSRRCRTTSNHKSGGGEEGARAGEI